MAIFYKIRNKKNPLLFKSSGTYGTWDKKGKMYDTLGKLRTAITGCMNNSNTKHDFSNWEIVEYEVKELPAKELIDIIDPKKIVDLLKQSA